MNKKMIFIFGGFLFLSLISYFVLYNKTVSEKLDLNDAHLKFVVDIEKDINLLKQRAEEGNVTAMSMLGHNYLYGIKVDKNINEAINWLSKAAKQNDARAQGLLGDIYLSEKSVQDYSKALFWYEKSAYQDNEAAQLSLAKLYATGLGVTKNMETASQWLDVKTRLVINFLFK